MYKRRTRTRLVTAIALISASFISAFVLSSLSNRTVMMWSGVQNLPPGHIITMGDLAAVRVSLPDGNSDYVNAGENLEGTIVIRSIQSGELIPVSALSNDLQVLETTSVPISVHASDIPINLEAGALINLYHVGDARLNTDIGPPTLLLAHAYILGIDRKGANLGGDLSMTIAINEKRVLQVLEATSTGRVVVVSLNG